LFRRNFKISIFILILLLSAATAFAAGINIPSGSALNINTGTLNVPGDISFSGTLQISTGAINLSGSWSNSGTFTAGSATVTFNATSGTPSITSPPANGAFYNLIFNDAGAGITFTLNSAIDIDNNLTITGGTLDANSQTINVGGNWDNNDTFTANNSTVIFDASTTGKTIESGGSAFNNIEFNNPSGGWTIQTDNLTATGDFSITNCASVNGFIVQANRTITVNGTFTNAVGGNATTWNSGTTLNLTKTGGGSYTINTKTTGADDYIALQVGANTHIRMWNSQATTYTVNATGSIYSMDHAGIDGSLYIWGDYYVPANSTDYWSYATDFDGASLSGSERQANVRLADQANVTCGQGETLEIIGTSSYPTTINRQGASGSYGIDINDGSLNADYLTIEYIDGTGLNILGSNVTMLKLDNASFDNSGGTGSSDAFITVAGESITNNPGFVISNININNTNTNADYNVTATGTTTSLWKFTNSTGTFDGESYDNDPGGNPGYLVWDDSAGTSINISGVAYEDDNEVTTVNGARVSLAVNDQYHSYVTTDSGNGSFTFTGVSVSQGDTLTFFFDGEGFVGSTVTIANTTNITDMRIYKNHVITRTETGGALSIAQMAKYDKDLDTDINFDAEDLATDTLVIDDGSELFIPAGEEFQPAGNLESGTNGVYDVDIRGTFTCLGSEVIRVSGSWLKDAAATFTAANSTVKFDATSGTPSINPQGADFYNVIFDGTVTFSLGNNLTASNDFTLSNTGTVNLSNYNLTVAGTLTLSAGTLNASSGNIDVDGDISLTSGTLIAPGPGKSFTVGGNWANTSGIFTSGTGKVTFNKASGTQTINAGGTGNDNKDFYNLEKTGSGTLQLVSSGLEVDGTLTVGVSATLDLNGQDLNVGTLNNSGIVQMLGSESSVVITNMDTAKGKVVYVGDGDATPEIFTIKDFGAIDYYDLTINDTNTTKDIFRTAADLYVNHNLEVLNGEIDISFNGNTLVTTGALTINGGTLTATDANIDANSTVTVSSGTLTAPTSGKYFRIADTLSMAGGSFNNSSGTVTFDATGGSPTIDSGGNSFYNIEFNDAGNNITFTLNSDIVVNDLTITRGTLNTGSNHSITVGGNWLNSDKFVSNNSLVTFNKASGTQTIDAGGTGNDNKDFYNLTKTGAGTLQLTNTGLEIDGTLTISESATLDLNGRNLNAVTLDNSGTIKLQGPETVSITNMDTDSGTVKYVGDADTFSETFNIAGFGSSQYYNLSINDTNTTKDIFQTTQDLSVSGDLNIDGGTLTSTNYNIDVNGSVTLTSGTFNAPGIGKTLTVGDDFTIAGEFNPDSGTVVFDDNTKASTLDAPAGGLNFYDFTCNTGSKVLNFTANDTFTVTGAFTLNGNSTTTRIDLNSTGGSGTTWNLILNGTYSVQYVDVQGSNASGTVQFPINPIGSLNSGDNTNWFPVSEVSDPNALRSSLDRHTFYDGTYYWAFYIDDNSDVVYKRSNDGISWPPSAQTVSAGAYTGLGIWEDGTYVYACYSDGANSYERKITISNEALGTERTLTSVADYHSQVIKDTSGYLYRKAEGRGSWKVYNYMGSIGTNASINVDITAVSNLDRAFILAPAGHMTVGVGAGGATQNANGVLIRAKFNGTSQVTLTRGTSTGDSMYSFFVIEDDSGNEIYTVGGSSTFNPADTSLTITPTDVPGLSNITDTAKCLVFLTASSDQNNRTYYNQAHVRGWVNSSKNLQLRRTGGNATVIVDWFVVEFKGTDWSVQQGDFSLTTGTQASPQTQSITSVNTENTFVFMNWEANTNGLDYVSAKVELYDSTTLRFSRQDVTTGTCTLRWFVVSHPNLKVQRGTDYAASTDTTQNQPITQIDTSRAFPITFNDCNGTGTNFPYPYWRAWFSNSTTLNWERSVSGQDNNFLWQVIELPGEFYCMRSTNAAGDDSAWNAEEEIGEDTNGFGHICIVPIASGNVMAIYNDYKAGTYNLRYKIYDSGTQTWGSEQTVVTDCKDNTAFSNWDDTNYFSAVSDISGVNYLVYLIYVDSVSGYIKSTTYNSGTSSWTSPETVSNSGSCSSPALFYDETYGTIYAFWIDGNSIKYKRKEGPQWPTNETTFKSNLTSPSFLGTAYSDTENIGIIWREGTGSFVSYGSVQITATIVSLGEFYALGLNNQVKVFWKTLSEIDNAGFNIYRSQSSDSGFTKINASLIPGLGTSMTGGNYSYLDTDVTNGSTYYYILESVESGGKTRKFGPVVAHPGLDSDSDGMTDDYEYYYGLDPRVNDAGLDPDHDGLTNLQEFGNLTDPFSAPDELLKWESSQPGAPGITVISSSDSQITLELVTNKFDVEDKVVGADTYHTISFPEYSHGYNEDPGKPMVPLKGALLGMQGKAPLNLEVLEFDKQNLSGYNIYPVPQRVLVVEGGVTYLKTEFYKDNVTYSQDILYPNKLAEIDYSSYLRNQEVAKIKFYPLQFNPVTGNIEFYNRLRVRLTWQTAAGPSGLNTGGSAIPEGTANALKILVNENGIYHLTYQNLIDAGLTLSGINPQTFKLYNKGEELPIYVYGEGDGVFNDTDYIEFYGEKENTRYTYNNVYWLSWGNGIGKRMADKTSSGGITPTAFLYTNHYERNEYYWSEFQGVADPWYFNAPIKAGENREFTFNLDDVANPADNGVLSVNCKGYNTHKNADLTYHIKIYLNNYLVNDVTWQGEPSYTASIDIPSYWLLDGTNTVKIEHILYDPDYPNSWVFVDWIDTSYWRKFQAKGDYLQVSGAGVGDYTYVLGNFTQPDVRAYDITDPKDVKRITNVNVESEGATYKATFNDNSTANAALAVVSGAGVKSPSGIAIDEVSHLRDTSNQADYIIITHDDFYNQILPLAQHRQSQGLTVKVARLSDVYDEFNYGIPSPYAIKYFLSYAYANWQKPAPTYVLLVGDATYDYRDDEGTGFTNYLPTYLVYNAGFGETASDSWFVCFDSEEDVYPEMLIGRFPAKTGAEVTNMVNKTISYEAIDIDEPWTKKVLFVSDNTGTFEAISDNLANSLSAAYTPVKLYLSSYSNPLNCRQDIIIKINQGALMVNYTGHGGVQIWADEQIFRNEDISSLTNQNKYPFIVTLNCVNGYFTTPRYFECLAEELMRPENKGAVAVFAPSGISLPTHQAILAEGLYDSLFKQKERILGSAIARAKLYLFQEAGSFVPDVLETFNLFGDPALVLRKEAVLPPETELTSPSIYKHAPGAPLYAFNVPQDISQVYPDILFEGEKPTEEPLPKEKQKVALTSPESKQKPVIEELLSTQKKITVLEKPTLESKEAISTPENKIVRLGPIRKKAAPLLKEERIIPKEKELLKGQGGKEGIKEGLGLWEKIKQFFSKVFGFFSARKATYER